MTDKQRSRWLIVTLTFLIGIGVGVGGSWAWVGAERFLEHSRITTSEGSDFMYYLAAVVGEYRAKTQQFPNHAQQAIELLPQSVRDAVAERVFYQKGKLIWSVRDGVPQPLADGRRVVCWFWNPERKHLVAAIVVKEDGSLWTEILPLRSVLQTL